MHINFICIQGRGPKNYGKWRGTLQNYQQDEVCEEKEDFYNNFILYSAVFAVCL